MDTSAEGATPGVGPRAQPPSRWHGGATAWGPLVHKARATEPTPGLVPGFLYAFIWSI